MTRLLLASSSPRRRELLHQIGVAFEVVPGTYDERMDPAQSPQWIVEHNALGKALSVQPGRAEWLILGSDTIVVLEGRILGKPTDKDDAARMLGALAGRWHSVYTGIALIQGERRTVRHRSTRVRIRTLAPEQIETYIAGGEPMDKAGAYGIQGIGATLVEAVEGCYTNVVGLSLPLLVDMLGEYGFRVL